MPYGPHLDKASGMVEDTVGSEVIGIRTTGHDNHGQIYTKHINTNRRQRKQDTAHPHVFVQDMKGEKQRRTAVAQTIMPCFVDLATTREGESI